MLDFAVQDTMLENGLKILLVEHRLAPITSVWIWYRVGSRNESPGITGISHWTEHMCFKGGKEFGKGEIFKAVSRVGGYNNGMTSTDFTVYFETVPAAYAELALRIEADRMTNARFDPQEVEAERTVIISEREGAENFPQFLLQEELALMAYRVHPYRWSVIGWKSDLKAITREDLWNYYKTYYAPNNAVLVIVGDFETEQMLQEVQRYFGAFSGHFINREVRSQEPPQEGERRFVLQRPGTTSYIAMAYHIPQAGHPDEPALRVLTSILSGTGAIAWLAPSAGGWKTSRLYRALVETELATEAACTLIPAQIDPGLGYFQATVRTGVAPERVEEALLNVIEEACTAPPSEEELERAKTQIRAAAAYAGESATGLASLLGRAEMTGSYRAIFELLPQVEAVTAEDVWRVAQTYLQPSNRTIGVFMPTDASDKKTASGGGKYTATYAAQALAAQRGSFPASPQSLLDTGLESRHNVSLGVNPPCFFYIGLEIFRQAQRARLDNGLRVVACRYGVTPAVTLAGAIRAGGCLDTEAQAGRAAFSAATMERGTQKRTFREIAEALDGIGATFSLSASLEYVNFGGTVLSEKADLLLDIAADILQHPIFPPEECEKVRTEILTSLQEAEDNTRVAAVKAARKLLYPAGHPAHVWEAGELATVERLRREDLMAYHQQALRPEQTFIVLVGDMEAAQLIELAAKHFGSWRSESHISLPDLSASPPKDVLSQEVLMPAKSQCDIVLATTGVSRLHEDYLALDFATRLLGQLGFMGRLGKTVRDEMGLAYYCFADMSVSRGNGMWRAQAGVNPANVALALETMRQQIQKMQQELVSEEEYEELLANRLGSLQMLLETKNSVAASLLNIELWDLGADYYERLPDLIKQITRERILEAARRYFPAEAYVRVIVGPGGAWQKAL